MQTKLGGGLNLFDDDTSKENLVLEEKKEFLSGVLIDSNIKKSERGFAPFHHSF